MMFQKAYMIIGQLLPTKIQDYLGLIRRYSIFGKRGRFQQCLVCKVDGTSFHGGLCDRFKGIISLFCFCLCNHIDFRIYYIFPFPLTDFLLPNKYDWKISEQEMCKNIFHVKLLRLIGDPTAKRLVKLHTKKQLHCYANRNIVDELNSFYYKNYQWGDLFFQLFRPTEELQNLISFHKQQIGGRYISAAFRFQNLLGDFSEYNYSPLERKEQKELMEKCQKALVMLLQKTKYSILVTSDSASFLCSIQGMKDIYAIQGKAAHVDTVANAAHSVYLKSFLDFFLLAEGEEVYSIGSKEMYQSEFPMCASWLHNVPFSRITI